MINKLDRELNGKISNAIFSGIRNSIEWAFGKARDIQSTLYAGRKGEEDLPSSLESRKASVLAAR